jgi:hypothetical protein
MAVVPEERGAFRQRFREASSDEDGRCCKFLRQTPIAVIAKAFGCEPFQLRSVADMFPGSRTESEFLNEFFILDVVLNRAPPPAVTGDNKKGEKDYGKPAKIDYDEVRPVVCYEPEHLGLEIDYLYRAAILFLSQCGAFYCPRERRRGDVGVLGTLTAQDMSWLCLQRDVSSPQTNREVSYTFGEDSFIRRFFSECKEGKVSAWRISTGYRHCSLQNRIVYRVHQSHDAPMQTHFVDVVIDIDEGKVVGWTRNRESVVMIRNVTKIDARNDHLHLLELLTLGCAQLRVSEAKGTARAKSADVGTMFAIGTRIP